jgi:hypothetical protein
MSETKRKCMGAAPVADKTVSAKTVNPRRRQVVSGLGALAAAAATPMIFVPRYSWAAKWPERPITLVIMYAAGGGTDVGLRAISSEMAKATGWDINVINKPGGVGAVATSFVLDKPDDGYWWMGAANYNKFVRVMGASKSVAWQDWQNSGNRSGRRSSQRRNWGCRPLPSSTSGGRPRAISRAWVDSSIGVIAGCGRCC